MYTCLLKAIECCTCVQYALSWNDKIKSHTKINLDLEPKYTSTCVAHDMFCVAVWRLFICVCMYIGGGHL